MLLTQEKKVHQCQTREPIQVLSWLQLGDKDDFTESDTEAAFEDSAKDEARMRSKLVQASIYRKQAR